MAWMLIAAKRFDFGHWFDDHGVTLISVLVVAIVVTVVSRILVSRFGKRLEGEISATQALNLQRAATLTRALSTSVVALIWIVSILLILGNLNVVLAPLLASA